MRIIYASVFLWNILGLGFNTTAVNKSFLLLILFSDRCEFSIQNGRNKKTLHNMLWFYIFHILPDVFEYYELFEFCAKFWYLRFFLSDVMSIEHNRVMCPIWGYFPPFIPIQEIVKFYNNGLISRLKIKKIHPIINNLNVPGKAD